MTVPWIISVDDHVVEPPNVWTDRLSKRDQERGPRVVQDTCETIYDPTNSRPSTGGGSVGPRYIKGGNGPLTDWWVYEDLAKTTPTVSASVGVPPERHSLSPINYTDMRPGCYDMRARIADMDLNHVERSLCFPLQPRFAGQWFAEAKDKDLAAKWNRNSSSVESKRVEDCDNLVVAPVAQPVRRPRFD
jgi:hypothetical protein